MQPTVRPESELLESKLDDWDAVLLCNVQQFTPAEAAALREYLARGGGVGFFLGSHVNAAAYNQVLYDNGKGILPVRLMEATGDAEKTEKAFHFDPLGYKHPIAASFADNPRAGLLTANIFRYFRLEIPKEFEDGRRPPAVALGFQGTKDPAIVVGRSGRGKVAVIATGADMDWNRWAPSTSYLPVIKKLVNELAASDGQRAGVTVGETLAMPLPRQGFDVTANLTIPGGGGNVPLKAEERDGVSALVYPNPEIGGVYSVAVGPPVSATWKYAVNTPPSESDLARWSDADLKSLFPGWQFSVRERWGSETAPSADGVGDDASVHPFLLWAALALVFLETLLAWRCGHHG